jgi:hypothetical protein
MITIYAKQVLKRLLLSLKKILNVVLNVELVFIKLMVVIKFIVQIVILLLVGKQANSKLVKFIILIIMNIYAKNLQMEKLEEKKEIDIPIVSIVLMIH